jgi:hypothetical protein
MVSIQEIVIIAVGLILNGVFGGVLSAAGQDLWLWLRDRRRH